MIIEILSKRRAPGARNQGDCGLSSDILSNIKFN